MLFLFLAAAALNVLLWAYIALPWWNKEAENQSEEGPSLSVIIAARNESANLNLHLAKWLSLPYVGDWELILVLDRCTDDSEAFAQSLQGQFARLNVISIERTPPDWAPKKWALNQGMEAAQYDHFLFMDADCDPAEGWLQAMGGAFAQDKELILGLGPYLKRGGLLNAFVRYETFLTGLMYIGLARWGRPYMAVGRNLAYTRTFFEQAGGFSAHRQRLSGDDDLLVNAAGKSAKIGTLVTGSSQTLSEAPPNWRSWYHQKIRHLSAGTAYRFSSQLFLGLFHGVHAIFYLSSLLVLWDSQDWQLLLGTFFVRYCLLLGLLWKPFRKWGPTAPVGTFLLSDILYLFYNLLLFPASLVSQPKWKG